MDPTEIFKGELDESIQKMRTAAQILHAFKEAYEDHKNRLKSYFSGDMEIREWDFAPKLVFARYDRFTERVEAILVCMLLI